jgi:hypothetical protein
VERSYGFEKGKRSEWKRESSLVGAGDGVVAVRAEGLDEAVGQGEVDLRGVSACHDPPSESYIGDLGVGPQQNATEAGLGEQVEDGEEEDLGVARDDLPLS